MDQDPVRGVDWSETVVRVEGRRASLLDVVLCGVHSGGWQELESQTAHGLALEAAGHPAVEAVIGAEITLFRYAHRLISADDFRGWLAARTLRLADVQRYVARKWLRENASDDDAQPLEDVGQLMVDAVCSGMLHRCATLLGRQLVACIGETPGTTALVPSVEAWLEHTPLRTVVPAPDLLASAQRVAGYAAAHHRLRASLADPRSLQDCLSANAAGWVRVSLEVMRFGAAGQAREARLLLLEGERAEVLLPHAVAQEEVDVFLEDAEPGLQVELLRHHAVDDVLCWPAAGSWQVGTVRRHALPALEDQPIMARACDTLLDHELTRRGAGKVLIDAAL